MPNLYVFRHGEAVTSLPDFDRPLNEKGLSDIEKVSKEFNIDSLRKTMFATSPAVRTLQTAEILQRNLELKNMTFVIEENGYLANDVIWFAFLEKLPKTFGACIIVGHNPGITNLLQRLTGEDILMLPGTGVKIRLLTKEWKEVFDGTGEVTKIFTP